MRLTYPGVHNGFVPGFATAITIQNIKDGATIVWWHVVIVIALWVIFSASGVWLWKDKIISIHLAGGRKMGIRWCRLEDVESFGYYEPQRPWYWPGPKDGLLALRLHSGRQMAVPLSGSPLQQGWYGFDRAVAKTVELIQQYHQEHPEEGPQSRFQKDDWAPAILRKQGPLSPLD